jgi:aspartyl-tRNA(Asn)/glutamyl-tRNA(Gln) amidotransferase subunit B
MPNVKGGIFSGTVGPLPLNHVRPATHTSILLMVSSGMISGKTAKDVLDHMMLHPDEDPKEFVTKHNLQQVTDTGAIEKIVDDIIANNADKAADAKANPKAIGWFVGQIMKASGGKANPKVVNDLLKSKLGS